MALPVRKNRLSYDLVKRVFESRGCILLSDIYVSTHSKLMYTCGKHPESVQYITFSNFREGHGCRKCSNEALSERQQNGAHWNYQGGITGISHHLRGFIKPWQELSLKAVGYKCHITGENGEFHIHHNIPFAHLVKQAHEATGVEVRSSVNQYTKEELSALEAKILDLHLDGELGIVMLSNVHKQFHKKYGKINNTIQQVEEFKTQYLEGNYAL